MRTAPEGLSRRAAARAAACAWRRACVRCAAPRARARPSVGMPPSSARPPPGVPRSPTARNVLRWQPAAQAAAGRPAPPPGSMLRLRGGSTAGACAMEVDTGGPGEDVTRNERGWPIQRHDLEPRLTIFKVAARVCGRDQTRAHLRGRASVRARLSALRRGSRARPLTHMQEYAEPVGGARLVRQARACDLLLHPDAGNAHSPPRARARLRLRLRTRLRLRLCPPATSANAASVRGAVRHGI